MEVCKRRSIFDSCAGASPDFDGIQAEFIPDVMISYWLAAYAVLSIDLSFPGIPSPNRGNFPTPGVAEPCRASSIYVNK